MPVGSIIDTISGNVVIESAALSVEDFLALDPELQAAIITVQGLQQETLGQGSVDSFEYEQKQPGDLIKSEEWNAAMQEITRIEGDKVSKTGAAAITGPLAVEEKVGIGTTTPAYGLDIKKSIDTALSIGPGGDGGRIWTQYKNNGPNLIFYDKDDPGIIRFTQSPTTNNEANPEHDAYIAGKYGNLGIGTANPNAKLQVKGDVVIGVSENLYALGALENLKVITGHVASNGTNVSGGGFEAERTDTGMYTITFSTPFAAAPVALGSPATDSDHVLTVYSISEEAFNVRIRDLSLDNLQNSSFTFIALGVR